MKISSRFSVAVHILSLLSIFEDIVWTSDAIAGSVNTNPVVIRRVVGMLKKAGIVRVNAGCGGAYLLKPTENITLFDVYKAVEVVEDGHLFKIHEEPNSNCFVGANIENVLECTLLAAQSAMEKELKKITITDIANGILKKIE